VAAERPAVKYKVLYEAWKTFYIVSLMVTAPDVIIDCRFWWLISFLTVLLLSLSGVLFLIHISFVFDRWYKSKEVTYLMGLLEILPHPRSHIFWKKSSSTTTPLAAEGLT